MQSFEITGRNPETGRKRKRTVRAWSEQEARALAEADGLTDLSVSTVPETPATDRQLAYAKDLGIQIPENATSHEMSDLISVRVDHDKPAGPMHKAIAQEYGVDFTPYIGKRALFDQILRLLSEPGRENELVAWFAYRVSRELFRGKSDAPVDGPDHSVIREIACELAQDETVIKSIRRYEGRNLIWFGQYTSPDGGLHTGGSNETIAYKQCMTLLREKLGLAQPTKRTSASDKATAGQQERSNKEHSNKGCLGSVAFVLVGIFFMFGTFLLVRV